MMANLKVLPLDHWMKDLEYVNEWVASSHYKIGKHGYYYHNGESWFENEHGVFTADPDMFKYHINILASSERPLRDDVAAELRHALAADKRLRKNLKLVEMVRLDGYAKEHRNISRMSRLYCMSSGL